MSESYIPLVHLATDISISGGEMLEKMGSMRACHWLRDPGMAAVAFADIEKAVEKASRAVALYKLAIVSGRESFTGEEYAALLKSGAASNSEGEAA